MEKKKAVELVAQFKNLKWDSGRFVRDGEKGKYKTRQMTDQAAIECAKLFVRAMIAEHADNNHDRWQYWMDVLGVLENPKILKG